MSATTKGYRPDLEPGFWPEYRAPASHVLDAVQYPLDSRWQSRVLAGVVKDARHIPLDQRRTYPITDDDDAGMD